jgi:hypothetical protein
VAGATSTEPTPMIGVLDAAAKVWQFRCLLSRFLPTMPIIAANVVI